MTLEVGMIYGEFSNFQEFSIFLAQIFAVLVYVLEMLTSMIIFGLLSWRANEDKLGDFGVKLFIYTVVLLFNAILITGAFLDLIKKIGG